MTQQTLEESWLTRRQQARRYSCSVRTVERWGVDPDLGYPDEIEINGRFRRPLSKLERWERRRVVKR